MESLYITHQLIRLKHICLLLRQTPEGWPLPMLIMEYNALREFLSVAGADARAVDIVAEHGSDWIRELR